MNECNFLEIDKTNLSELTNTKKEQSVLIPLLKAFSAEKIKLQPKAIENERVSTEIYFSEHKFAVEIDEKGHTDRDQNEENKRQTKIEKYSDCKFSHRINPDGRF